MKKENLLGKESKSDKLLLAFHTGHAISWKYLGGRKRKPDVEMHMPRREAEWHTSSRKGHVMLSIVGQSVKKF